MKTNTVCLFLFGSLLSISGMAQPGKDSTQVKRNYTIDEVVVTGTRNRRIFVTFHDYFSSRKATNREKI